MDAPDDFYSIALKELTSRNPVPGVFARAIADSGGDEARTRALYIKYRVARLQEETAARAEAEVREKERAEEERRAAFVEEFPQAKQLNKEDFEAFYGQYTAKKSPVDELRKDIANHVERDAVVGVVGVLVAVGIGVAIYLMVKGAP